MNERMWQSYIQTFHEHSPGITERVLVPAMAGGGNQYQWIAEAVETSPRVLDLAGGSSPIAFGTGDMHVTADLSINELALAHTRGRTCVRASANALPFADSSFDAVVCSMALMLLQPLDTALKEIRRVLRLDGLFVATRPVTRPLTGRDRRRYVQLLLALRTIRLQSPNHKALKKPGFLLAASGFNIEDLSSVRFEYSMSTDENAALMVDSLYVPTASLARRHAASRLAQRWVPDSVGIPIQRMVARKS